MLKHATDRMGRSPGLLRCGMGLMLALVLLLGAGCASVFNPSFIALVNTPTADAEGETGITISNAPGHIPIVFINNTRFDQGLLNYLASIGVDVSDPDLRPRVRVRTGIEYVNGNTLTIEFLSGSDLIQTAVQTAGGVIETTLIPSSLLERDLENVVAVCNVATVKPGAAIEENELSVEVFIPAFLKEISIVTNDLIVTRELNQTIEPQFIPLQPDQVDDNFNVTLTRNFDIRDVPVPAEDLLCGVVVGFTLEGVLRLPFVQDELGQSVPGFLATDTTAQAGIPGRFSFETTVR